MTSTPSKNSATADLFAVLRAMAADPSLSELAFRVGFTVAQAVNERTGWAEISDEKLTVKAGVSLQQAQRGRRLLRAAGWVRTVSGKRGQGTRYLFLAAKAQPILDRVKAAIEAIDDRRTIEAIQHRVELATQSTVVDFDRETDEIATGEKAGFPIKIDMVSSSNLTPLLPQRSTSQDMVSGTVQDVATGADRGTGEIPPPVTGEGQPVGNPASCVWCRRLATGFDCDGDPACEKHAERMSSASQGYWAASRGE